LARTSYEALLSAIFFSFLLLAQKFSRVINRVDVELKTNVSENSSAPIIRVDVVNVCR
jgi:hypothetical protein